MYQYIHAISATRMEDKLNLQPKGTGNRIIGLENSIESLEILEYT